MPQITLPDGSHRSFDDPVTVMDVAGDIGPGLARATLAGRVDGKLVDASYTIENDAELAIVTDRDEEGLEIVRHSTAHLLAQAVKELYPETQVTIGPVIEDGFYYDFARPEPFTEADLAKIEKKMAELAKQDFAVSRKVMSRDEAVTFFRDMGEEYKAEIIESIPKDEELSLYQQGDFIDLCRGPHVPSTGKLKAFKLMKVAGAYWRGDSSNEMLQRIYGTAWTDKKALKAYLHRLEEAEKRDHRRLGRQLNLFHSQEEAPGMVFWHDHGWTIYQQVEQYIRNRLRENGYQEVKTPEVVDRVLVAVFPQTVTDVLFHLLIDGPAMVVPEHHARGFLLAVEQVELPTQATMVPLFGLFQTMQIGFQGLLVRPGGAVDALQHFIAGVAPPVGPGHFHELERLELAGGWHVRPATQVNEITLLIER